MFVSSYIAALLVAGTTVLATPAHMHKRNAQITDIIFERMEMGASQEAQPIPVEQPTGPSPPKELLQTPPQGEEPRPLRSPAGEIAPTPPAGEPIPLTGERPPPAGEPRPLPAGEPQPLPLPAGEVRPSPSPAGELRPSPLPAGELRPSPLPAGEPLQAPGALPQQLQPSPVAALPPPGMLPPPPGALPAAALPAPLTPSPLAPAPVAPVQPVGAPQGLTLPPIVVGGAPGVPGPA